MWTDSSLDSGFGSTGHRDAGNLQRVSLWQTHTLKLATSYPGSNQTNWSKSGASSRSASGCWSKASASVLAAKSAGRWTGSKCHLALFRDRVGRQNLGGAPDAPLIDQLHHAMHLWSQERRGELVGYLRDHDLFEQGPFWKLAQALFEVLPRDEADWKLVSALLGERETLRMEARRAVAGEERTLFD